MTTTDKALPSMTARELMTDALVLIREEMSLQHAAHLLSQANVSGAPVVDAEGRCVGVLSATDFLHWADRGAPPSSAKCICEPWQIVDSEKIPEESVRNFMTNDPVTIAPNLPMADVARQMLDAHIHRLIVVDEHMIPMGIVSSTDILAAVAYAEV